MTKAEFFRCCEKLQKGEDCPPLYVDFRTEIVNGIGMERCVYLHGLWSNGCITHIELYRPMPGRQWPDWQTAKKRGEEARKKYKRWLDEFLNRG